MELLRLRHARILAQLSRQGESNGAAFDGKMETANKKDGKRDQPTPVS